MSLDRPLVDSSRFDGVLDPRVDRTKRHLLGDVLSLCVVSFLGGADSWVDVERFGLANFDWFRRHLRLPHGIPSHDTIGRVMAAVCPLQLAAAVREWLTEFRRLLDDEVIAIDGKRLAASGDAAAGKPPLHVVSAWACEARLVLGQLATDAKSNEITAVPRLLELIDVAGATVTVDALNAQKETAAAIRERGGDYVMALKGNHKNLHLAATDLMVEAASEGGPDVRQIVRREKGHGRLERRTYIVTAVPDDFPGREEWRDLRSIGAVVRERTINAVTKVEVRHYLTSLPPQATRFAKAVRSHWGIENRLHWSLDVTFSEDRGRMRVGHAAENAGALRRLVLSLLKQDTSLRGPMRGKRLMAGWNRDILEGILRSLA
jgi:predicted transposase YbfD/YdcC